MGSVLSDFKALQYFFLAESSNQRFDLWPQCLLARWQGHVLSAQCRYRVLYRQCESTDAQLCLAILSAPQLMVASPWHVMDHRLGMARE